MTRMSVALVVAAAVSAAGCSQSPVSPSAAQGGLSSTAVKPGSGSSGPDSTAHTLAFTGDVQGSGGVSGWITGTSSGNLLVHATSGNFSLTITGTSDSGTPAQDAECTDQTSDLYKWGLIGPGTAIEGSLTIDVDQDGSKSNTDPTMDWELGGVQDNEHRTWRVSGISTYNFPPKNLTGDASGMSVQVDAMKVLFSRLATSGRKNSTDLSFGCRVDLQMTMTPIPPPPSN